MKRTFLLLALLAPVIISAQVKLGVIIGYHSTNIGSYDLVESHNIGNVLVGMVSEYRIAKSSFHIGGQAVYTTMGYGESNIQSRDKSGNPLGRIDLHRIGYVKVPVYLLYAAETKAIKIKMGVGPFVAIQTGDKLKTDGGESFGNGTALPLQTKRINPVLYGAYMQGGIEWSSFDFSFHFSPNFNGLYQNQSSVGLKWKAAAYGFSISYFFKR